MSIKFLSTASLIVLTSAVFTFLIRAQTAPVVINEIAWAGTQTSANDEWIELYNSSAQAIELNGWSLRAVDGTPNIALEGIIPAGGFFLLERTDDTTVIDIPADLIYTGALSNSSETLELVNAEGVAVDRVSQWYAGDATARTTMERKSAALSGDDPTNWQTSDGTPRAPNSAGVPEPAEEAPPSDESGIQTATPAGPEATLSITGPASVIPGKIVDLSVIIEGFTPDEINWNFGDGFTAIGETVEHTFSFPGQYLVVASANFAGQTITDQLLISVFETAVRISEFIPNPEGKDAENEWIELQNASERVVDLSEWQLRVGKKKFEFAQHSFLLPGQFLVLPRPLTKLTLANTSGLLQLLHPSGEIMDEVRYEEDVKEGWSAARKGDEFLWSSLATPGSANVILGEVKESAQTLQDKIQSVKSVESGAGKLALKGKTYIVGSQIRHYAGLGIAQAAVVREALPDELDEIGIETGIRDEAGIGRISGSDNTDYVSPKNFLAKLGFYDATGLPREVILFVSVIISASILGISYVLRKRKQD